MQLLSVAASAAPLAVPLARRLTSNVAQGESRLRDAADTARRAVDVGERVKSAVDSHSSGIGKAAGVVGAIVKGGGGNGAPKLSHLIEEHTDVALPRRVVFEQWSKVEAFPSIVKGADSVSKRGSTRSTWTSKIGPSRRTWEAVVSESVPGERIAFKSRGGLKLHGEVTFHSLDRSLTRVHVQMVYEPTGFVEWVGNLLRIQRRRVRRDLRLFKHHVELHDAMRRERQDHDEQGTEQSSNGSRRPSTAGRATAR